MQAFGRVEPLPIEMQGRWVVADDPSHDLVIRDGEITYAGLPIPYDLKTVRREGRLVIVQLDVNDPAENDEFFRSYIGELVMTFEGDFYGLSSKFDRRFVRPEP